MGEARIPDAPMMRKRTDNGSPNAGAHLVGHSFGGCCALAAAAKRPAAVRSLVLIEPGMQKLAAADRRVRRFGLKMVWTLATSFTAESRAKRFAKLLNIPDAIRGGSSQEEFKRMGRGIAHLRLPNREELLSELNVVKAMRIPLLVVTGGWSESFDAVGEAVAIAGGGQHVIVRSPHHFPQLMSDEFNPLLVQFMREASTRTGPP